MDVIKELKNYYMISAFFCFLGLVFVYILVYTYFKKGDDEHGLC